MSNDLHFCRHACIAICYVQQSNVQRRRRKTWSDCRVISHPFFFLFVLLHVLPWRIAFSRQSFTQQCFQIIEFNMADSYVSASVIADLAANVNTAAAKFVAATEGDLHVARRNLQLEARKLLYSLEEPNTEVWPRIFQVRTFYQQSSPSSALIKFLLPARIGKCERCSRDSVQPRTMGEV